MFQTFFKFSVSFQDAEGARAHPEVLPLHVRVRLQADPVLPLSGLEAESLEGAHDRGEGKLLQVEHAKFGNVFLHLENDSSHLQIVSGFKAINFCL